MLKFYFNPISVNARRVWMAMLEKQIPFEPILVKLDGDQFDADFTKINPLQRIPVIIDNDVKIWESLAILDYLEAQYPVPSLMPQAANSIGMMRMVEMMAVNELQPATIPLTGHALGLTVDSEKIAVAKERIITVIQFYESLLNGHHYFVADKLTLADIVAGTLVSSLPFLGFSLDAYPSLMAWLERLAIRESWQATTPSPQLIETALPSIRAILLRRL